MATKKINFKSLSTVTLSVLSDFVNADIRLKELRAAYKADCDAIEESIAKMLSDREEYLAQFPHNSEEARKKFSTVELTAKLNARKVKFQEDCKPFRAAQKPALDLVDKNAYYGYVHYMATGSTTSKVDITLTKGEKSEHIKLGESYKDIVNHFLVAMGLDYSDSKDKALYDKAIAKFAALMVARTAGVMRNSKDEGQFIKNKSERQYDNIFVLSFVDYLVNGLGMYTIDTNKTGSKYVLVLNEQ